MNRLQGSWICSAAVALAWVLLAAPSTLAAPPYCDNECDFNSCRTDPCTDPETFQITTCQAWGEYNFSDPDCDNINSSQDNCDYIANANQADCDSDGAGDVCDSENGTFSLVSGSERMCWIDSWTHWFWGTYLDGYIEGRYTDVSSCGSPDRWEIVVKYPEHCLFEWDRYICCVLGTDFTQSQCSTYLDIIIDAQNRECDEGDCDPDLCLAI